jgi:hypothetical protein
MQRGGFVQRKERPKGYISASEYARKRGLSPSTITRQIRSGAIPSKGGWVNPITADEARANNLNPAKRLAAEARKRDASPGALAGPKVAAGGVDGRYAERVAALAEITAPIQVIEFARACLELGLDAVQACAAAQMYAWMAANALADIDPDDLTDDPTPEQWTEALGGFDQEEADALCDSAMDGR